ncbi:hypothetical protein MRS44_016371 [Fusarium solani]|uniref:uncharacterized protein n=1 Tax=Fusarium solani TaxID=169388 RepID=UPI0032C4622C|nr:hypothetical protein MRS44_016371 [Fusarium solani]
MGLQHRLILVSILSASFLVPKALARDLSSPSLSEYPRCAAKCMISALQGGFCAPSNQTCICVDHEFQQNVTSCVSTSCTILEALKAKNSSLADCGAPMRDRSQQFVTLSTTLTVVAGVFVAIRFGYKLSVSTINIDIDDWLVLAAILSFIPAAVITVHGTTANGFGRDIWTLSPHHITTITRLCYILGTLYFLQTVLVKLAIIGFYIRIFPVRETQRLLWGTFIFTSLWGVAFVIVGIFPCTPISYFWNQWDGLHKGKCNDINAILWSHASFSVALDLWMLAVPLWQLRSLQLHWKKKIGVAFMFSVGTFVTVVSVIRFKSLVNFGKSINKTWELYNVSVWSTIEITVGIMCACLPTMRAVLVKIFPILSASSTQNSRGNQYYERHNSLPPMASRMGAQAVATASANRLHSDEEHYVETAGIIFHKTYGVRYSESDEARLMPGKSGNPFGQRKQ